VTDVKPLELDCSRRRTGGVSVLWMRRSTETRHCERLALGEPEHGQWLRLVLRRSVKEAVGMAHEFRQIYARNS
jgi:hypothetical protein